MMKGFFPWLRELFLGASSPKKTDVPETKKMVYKPCRCFAHCQRPRYDACDNHHCKYHCDTYCAKVLVTYKDGIQSTFSVCEWEQKKKLAVQQEDGPVLH